MTKQSRILPQILHSKVKIDNSSNILERSVLRRYLLSLALAVAPILVPNIAWSESYPTKPIRIVVPFSAGAATDTLARIVAQKLTESLGKTVVVENKPGANGIIGTDAVAKAPADGYTLLMTVSSAQTLNPSLYKLPYDPIKDFSPVSMVSTLGLVIVVHPSVPAKTIQEFIALAKSKPGQFNFAAGTSLVHLVGEQFKMATGIDMVPIPYKGTALQIAAVLAGEVAMTFDPFNAVPQIKAGKLRALAVVAPKRSSVLPEVPTLLEAGVQGVEFNSWVGLIAPAGTPPEIVTRLQAEISKIVVMPDVRERIISLSADPVGNTSAQFSRIIMDEIERWAWIVKRTNFKITD